jgi:two-component system, sensor histidine kinase
MGEGRSMGSVDHATGPRAWFANLPLRRKLTAIGVATSTISLLAASVAFAWYDLSTAKKQLETDSSLLAVVIGANSTAALAFDDSKVALETARSVAVHDNVENVTVWRTDGTVLAAFQRSGTPGAPAIDPARILAQQEWTEFTDGALTVARVVRLKGEVAGMVTVRSNLSDLREAARAMAIMLTAVMAGTLLLSFVLAARFQQLISTPLLRLTEATRAVARDGDYDVAVEGSSGAEIGELITGFNRMLSEVHRRDTELRSHQDSLERTVRERTSDLVVARDKAMEASRAKSEFLANMSHEIRTPMNGVLGMMEIINDTPLSGEQQEMLGIMRSSAESLLHVLNDILDFSKVEARQMSLESVPFSPRQCVESVAGLVSAQAANKGIDLTVLVAHGVPGQVVGDPVRVRQVLLNLVGNAIKFTTHGHVRVTAGIEPGAENPHRVWLRFSVEDSGIGVPPEHQERIFEAFSQADGSTTRRFGGTGLGLAISRSLVELMGGRLWVESQPGQGSTFHFTASFGVTVPARVAPVAEARPSTTPGGAAGPPGGGRHILLAEDNPTNQLVAVGLLKARGHRITVTHNGAEAVEAYKREPFDIVLMDVQMPVMGGFEATAAIRAIERGSGHHTPIIAMTAHAMEGDRERCLAAGMDGYLSKPIDKDALYTTVEAVPSLAST